MTECKYFDALNMKNTCRLCLITTVDVYAMSSKEVNLYQSFVNKISNMNWDMNVCMYCGWMLKKFQRFVEQCRVTNDMLNQVVDMDSKSFIFLNKMLNLTMSGTETHSFSSSDIFACQPTSPNGVTVQSRTDSDGTKDGSSDCDDVPLLMLSHCSDNNDGMDSRKRNFKKKHKLRLTVTTEELQNGEESKQDMECDRKRDKCKRLKNIREGFTSKMVQETGEYVVIKLTKDQVLQEMLQRSQSDSFLRAPYKCEKCIKGYNFEDVLLNHMERHTMKAGYLRCDICAQYCPTVVSLRGHIKSHTTRYKCKLCGHTRLSRQHLLEHHALAHTSAAITYSCDHCSFTTNKRTVIQRHVKTHAPIETHACDKCGKLFKNINSLRIHTIRHDKSKRLRCEQCDKTFIIPSLLQKHVLSVHERKDYYCVECDVKFKSPETMRLHFKRAKRHQDNLPYKSPAVPGQHACAQCERAYSTRAALRAHAHRTHHAYKKQDPSSTDDTEIRDEQENIGFEK